VHHDLGVLYAKIMGHLPHRGWRCQSVSGK
jgi:hypothetical protein